MKTCRILAFICLTISISVTVAGYHHYMMKALFHGAGMGMMMQQMRPRILPIPIPIPTGLFSGFRRQFEQPQVIVIQPQQKPRENIIVIGGQNEQACCW
ncbi:hypothetical protein AVEN_55287-1 [Araneus ventricosus]|uniref:Uncharacterized protein n=1 Tax=Araneus ventricosus TaxID=182803 RepID=A0A4Y2D877_ARAVE|nr:hypothetical protein AVEN_55287-1 [Araneus ventricosus]